jgi:hypothetical protein
MTLFIQNDATGAGAGNLDPNQAFLNLAVVANGDTGLGLDPQVGNRQQVTYARTDPGIPPTRLDNLVNTNFSPDYGGGPQNVDIVILPVLANFTLNNGTSILVVGGTALAPTGSGLAGEGLNNTNSCLVIYDTTQNEGNGYCTARAGTGGTLDLQTPNSVILYHELSHAFRIVSNALFALSGSCNPSSPEENAAITDENDLRTQIANAAGTAPELRDSGIHCGALCAGGSTTNCCIVASVASGSPVSEEVAALRSVRDGLLRRTEIGFAFFQSLHHDYYGFSPQVCTLMARHPALRPLVLEGFVRPLVSILRLVEQYALGTESAAMLGERFVADHTDRATGTARLDMLSRAQQVLNGSDAELTNEERELAQLLHPALVSEHLRWAIIEPMQFYQSALEAHLDGCSVERLGEHLYQAISAWAVRMPLDDVWASLSVQELQDELQMLEIILLHTAEVRAGFRDRLQREFGDLTAVAMVLGAQTPRLGEEE